MAKHDNRQDKQSKKPSAETENLQQQIDELTEALKRERADATNVRRRSEEERAKMAGFYKSMVVRELLPAIDNLERALGHIPKELEGNDFVKGVEAVKKQFDKALSDIGVEKIKTKGQPFDPKLHEAVAMEEGAGAQEVVSEELRGGYKIGDEIIRHAMVKVKMEDKQ